MFTEKPPLQSFYSLQDIPVKHQLVLIDITLNSQIWWCTFILVVPLTVVLVFTISSPLRVRNTFIAFNFMFILAC